MCGIFGYRGPACPVERCLGGLQRLAYRGYDSAGIAGVINGQLHHCREIGKLQRLKEALAECTWGQLQSAIAHTRWATHGKPTIANAHPQFDEYESLAVVHNGIIENHHALRQELMAKGVRFTSDTDTEVIAQLVAFFYSGDLKAALHQALQRLEGSWAIVLLHRDHPEQLFASTRNCPLMIARNHDEVMIASDLGAFEGEELEVLFLQDYELAAVAVEDVAIWDMTGKRAKRPWQPIPLQEAVSDKTGFEHFMLKEIFEQPNTLASTLEGRLTPDALEKELPSPVINFLSRFSHAMLIACGTSYHASCIAAQFLQEIAHVPVQAHVASEFRSQLPVVSPLTLIIAVSQSGETADTLAAVRDAKLKGATVIALCNVPHALLTRLADATLMLRAGQEISVCSTKAFTSQLALLTILSVWIARVRLKSPEMLQGILHELAQMPGHVAAILQQSPYFEKLAKKYAEYDHFFYVGRSYMFPAALESALKLKEIAYIDANGYPAGEMKHGPIALLTSKLPVVALCANKHLLDKLISNLMEIKARSAPIIALAFYGSEQIQKIVDDLFCLPQCSDALAPLTACVAGQLLAYFIAKERGADIDQPRNLAKSVTVE